MSDYLKRLAERVAGVVDAIKPRVPYRFERPVNSGVERHDDQLARTDGMGPQQHRAAKDPLESPRDVSRPQPLAPRAEASIVPGEPPPEPVKSSPVAATRAGTVPAPKPLAQADRAPSQKDASTSIKPREHDGAASSRIDSRKRELQSPQTGKPAATRSGTAHTASTIPLEHVAPTGAAVGHRSVAWLDEPQQVMRPSAEPQPVVRPRVDVVRRRDRDPRDLMRAMADLSAEGKAEQRQESAVTVTIGRVEVRAVIEPPKAPPRPRRAAHSAISLDEYLKRHEERRR
jgi:hypothetical protein